MVKNTQGMNTYRAQEKDRENWAKSIDYRNALISEAEIIGLKINRPQEMKIIELEALVRQHYKNRT